MEFDKLSQNEQAWKIKYDQLIDFRDGYKKWPVYDHQRKEGEENSLASFAVTTRRKYRENTLSHWQVALLKQVNFNFNGVEDNWFEKYERVKKAIETAHSVSGKTIGSLYRHWLINNWKKSRSGTLKTEQVKAIAALNLEVYFPTWEDQFDKLAAWVNHNKKLPTEKSAHALHSWMRSQRTIAKTGSLNAAQIDKLLRIGVYMQPRRPRSDDRLIWQQRFDDYTIWLVETANGNTHTMPKQMYNWVMDQRALFRGTKKHRWPLAKWKTDQLNAIGFQWSPPRALNKNWTVKFDELKRFIHSKNFRQLSKENGHLYRWLHYQLAKYKNGLLKTPCEEQLRSIGFNFKGQTVMNCFDE